MKNIFSVTNVILLAMALILFFGLFKREIQVWKYDNWPRFQEKSIDYKDICTKNEATGEYEKILKGCSISWDIKKYPSLRDFRQIAEPIEVKCINEKTATYSGSLYKEVKYNCDKTRKETWFFAFGKYWFKK